MPAHSSVLSLQLQKLAAKAQQNQTIFENAYPDLGSAIVEQEVLATPEPTALPLENRMARQISQEEYTAVVDKLTALSKLPPGKMDIETALYVEQQVSDLVGFQVATKLQNHELLHTQGSILALPHLKRSPRDTASDHRYPQAPFSQKRSTFGWIDHLKTTHGIAEDVEEYYIALPLHLIPTWSQESAALKEWYTFRKMLVLNPQEQLAVVCRVADSLSTNTAKYQFGGSPELILAGRCWSADTLGRVLVFFVVDDTNTIPVGPLSLTAKV
jgi:hypothetical protein